MSNKQTAAVKRLVRRYPYHRPGKVSGVRAAVRKHSDTPAWMTPNATLVLRALADEAITGKATVAMTRTDLLTDTRLSQAALTKALEALRDAGLLDWEITGRGFLFTWCGPLALAEGGTGSHTSGGTGSHASPQDQGGMESHAPRGMESHASGGTGSHAPSTSVPTSVTSAGGGGGGGAADAATATGDGPAGRPDAGEGHLVAVAMLAGAAEGIWDSRDPKGSWRVQRGDRDLVAAVVDLMAAEGYTLEALLDHVGTIGVPGGKRSNPTGLLRTHLLRIRDLGAVADVATGPENTSKGAAARIPPAVDDQTPANGLGLMAKTKALSPSRTGGVHEVDGRLIMDPEVVSLNAVDGKPDVSVDATGYTVHWPQTGLTETGIRPSQIRAVLASGGRPRAVAS